MQIISKPISLNEFIETCCSTYSEMVKIVVDIDKAILAADAEMHADLEDFLLDHGSIQKSLWGANIYPQKEEKDYIEFTSFINIRPGDNNRGMEVEDREIKRQISELVGKLIKK